MIFSPRTNRTYQNQFKKKNHDLQSRDGHLKKGATTCMNGATIEKKGATIAKSVDLISK
jgi:hypothetical protein